MSKKSLWCSPHQPTEEQLSEIGEVDYLSEKNPELYNQLINSPSNRRELFFLARDLLDFARKNNYNIYQPAGNPAFQYWLGLANTGIYDQVEVFYAYSERVSIEERLEDGSIRKVSIFKHIKFV